jgi:hypothetical protein
VEWLDLIGASVQPMSAIMPAVPVVDVREGGPSSTRLNVALAREEDGVPWLARTLDWPFPGLGRYADVVRLEGPAGEYFSVTWPGYAGVLTATAPSRFTACINQAPMYRRTQHPWLHLYDLGANGSSYMG